MKIRFLCLLSLVTVMVGYAPFARADEALKFDKAAPTATEETWMTAPRASSARQETALQEGIAPTEKPAEVAIEKTTEGTAAALAASAKQRVSNPIFSEPSAQPHDKPDNALKEAPSRPILSFTESLIKKASGAESPAEPAPAPAQPVPPVASAEPLQPEPVRSAPAEAESVPVPSQPAARKPVELGFSLSPTEPLYEPPSAPAAKADVAAGVRGSLFVGDENSLVAKAVGSAEGTRTPEGDRTRAYYGHVDPGNRVWNRGSFSYQHTARSPEEADQKQLQRLANQAQVIEARAADYGLQLTLEEKLNGIDLANQAPKAALDRGGYVDWLAKARQRGLSGTDAVLWARTRSFINPITQRWDAPGLGNTAEQIERDQARRMEAIARAIAANPNVVDQSAKVSGSSAPAAKANASKKSTQAAPAIEGEPGIAKLLAEKLVELFGGDRLPDSSPVANEPVGIQQLFGFAL
jgi:hypothetical protein